MITFIKMVLLFLMASVILYIDPQKIFRLGETDERTPSDQLENPYDNEKTAFDTLWHYD